MAVDAFVKKHLELLEIEHSAEIEENRRLQESLPLSELQRKGICLQKLRVSSFHTGLFGRSCITFEPYWPGKPLPSHSLGSGDIVGVGTSNSDSGRKILISGVVSRATQTVITVAFEENVDTSDIVEDQQYWLIKLANDVTYKRVKRALTILGKQANQRASNLISILFGDRTPGDPLNISGDFNQFFNSKLDKSQREAVQFALAQKEVAIIHGPPGTGKTTTVVEVIQQAVKQGLKVLACAPSNIAVDNLVERLAACKLKVIRLGHPARVLSNIHQYSLDAVLSRCDEHSVIEDLKKDIDKMMVQSRKMRAKEDRNKVWQERKHLFKELHEREKKAVKSVLQNADVILATLTTTSDDGPLKHLPPDHFNLVIIDECSQALEAACWIPLPLGQKCILAGDHLQLPPTIVSEKAAKEGLSLTLMERVLKLHGNKVMSMLTVQYRMHNAIMKWSSQQLYDDKLVAHASVESHLLCDLPGVKNTEDTCLPLLLIDTAGCDLHELELQHEDSQGNEGEANLVTIHVEKLISSGIRPADIGVITPYNLQVDLIKLRLANNYSALEIKSVDGFQGREKEAIILSLVRSNEKGEVGFLSDVRRINVAITRARRHLAVICDTETVSNNEFLKGLVEYMSSNGEVRSAHQYENELQSCDTMRPQHLQYKEVSKGKSGKNASKKSATKKSKPQVSNKDQGPNNVISHCPKEQERPNKVHQREDGEKVTAEMEAVVKEFLNDANRTEHSFPSTLTSFKRRIVHEVSENLGLIHESQGEGKDRYIVIRKKPLPEASASATDECSSNSAQNESSLPAQDTLINKSSSKTSNKYGNLKPEKLLAERSSSPDEAKRMASNELKQCKTCNKSVPINNFDLHMLRCKKNEKDQKSSSKDKTSKKQNLVKSQNLPETDDFDALIASVVKADSTCSYKGCKTCVSVLGQSCQFCKRRFCFSHSMPEVHGCGDAAKAHARSLVLKEGRVGGGTGKQQKKEDPVKKAYLQKKLDEKLSEMSQSRKSKRK